MVSTTLLILALTGQAPVPSDPPLIVVVKPPAFRLAPLAPPRPQLDGPFILASDKSDQRASGVSQRSGITKPPTRQRMHQNRM